MEDDAERGDARSKPRLNLENPLTRDTSLSDTTLSSSFPHNKRKRSKDRVPSDTADSRSDQRDDADSIRTITTGSERRNRSAGVQLTNPLTTPYPSLYHRRFIVYWEAEDYLVNEHTVFADIGAISVLSKSVDNFKLVDCAKYADCGHPDLLKAITLILRLWFEKVEVRQRIHFDTYGPFWIEFEANRNLGGFRQRFRLSTKSNWGASESIIRNILLRLAIVLRPADGTLSWSNGMFQETDAYTVIFIHSLEPAEIQACWRPLFPNKVIARLEPEGPANSPRTSDMELELEFDHMVALCAANYPIVIDDGLCLSGVYTLLVPVEKSESSDKSKVVMRWHLFTADDSKRGPSRARRKLWEEWTRWSQSKTWFKTQNLEELRSFPRHALGWTRASSITLGSSTQPYNLRRSNAPVKHLERAETTFNLGINLGHGGVGVTTGLSFKLASTEINRFHDRNQNIIDWLGESIEEQILLYHPDRKQAWLLPKISVVHHLLLERMHYMATRQCLRDLKYPFIKGDGDPYEVLDLLKENLDEPFPHWSNEGHCLRDALQSILCALDQFERSNFKAGTQRDFLGFEAYDAIHQTPYYRVDYANTSNHLLALRRLGGWVHLLEDVPIILFFRGIQDPIVSSDLEGSHQSLRRMPRSKDYLAATVESLFELAKKYGNREFDCTRLAREAFWHSEGVFQKCKNVHAEDSPAFELQAVWTKETAKSPPRGLLKKHRRGSVIFVPGTGISEKIRG